MRKWDLFRHRDARLLKTRIEANMRKIENLRRSFINVSGKLYHSHRTHNSLSSGEISHDKHGKRSWLGKSGGVAKRAWLWGCQGEPQSARKTKSIFQFFLVARSNHYERNFPVEKQINVSDSASNFLVYFLRPEYSSTLDALDKSLTKLDKESIRFGFIRKEFKLGSELFLNLAGRNLGNWCSFKLW